MLFKNESYCNETKRTKKQKMEKIEFRVGCLALRTINSLQIPINIFRFSSQNTYCVYLTVSAEFRLYIYLVIGWDVARQTHLGHTLTTQDLPELENWKTFPLGLLWKCILWAELWGKNAGPRQICRLRTWHFGPDVTQIVFAISLT